MRVPVQIISFSCFLFSLTVVRGQEVTCELKSKRFGVNKINPEGKTLFRAGESVVITCAERYWIFGTKEIIRSFTCQENGEWDHEPVCEDIRCEVPRDQHVDYPEYYFRGDMKVGAKKTYYCMRGYEQKAAVATCTRDGWTPKPLCAERMCAAPIIPNAEIVRDQRPKYYMYSRIQYKCRPGFEPEQLVEITCDSQFQWTGIRQCTAKPKLCPDLSVENGFIHTLSSNEEEIFYSCDTGYKPFSGNWWDSVTCSKGSWSEEPRCIRKEECGAFPSVHHGKLKQTKQIFHDGDAVAFECDPGFIPTQRFIKCVSGTWETPVCEVDVRCDIPPKVENAFITSKPEEFYVHGSSVTYVCGSSFSMNGKSTVFCRRGTWEEVPTCKEVICVANLTANMRSDVTEDRRTGPEVSVRSGHTITLSCVGKGVKLQGSSKITCLPDGQWEDPFPKCVGEATCPLNTTVEDLKMERSPDIEGPVKHGQKLKFSCKREGFKLKGEREITCLPNGEWSSSFPECEAETTDEVVCPINTTVEGLKMERSPDIKRPIKHGHKLIFSCKREGFKLKGEREITCLPNGEWSSSFPECEAETTDGQPDIN
ncbi:complement factor H isoform X12 [Ctenopharyngodon idella]|uniref:complement factor H isoform X12 n=1 Tax=Ctenopharyngodon idella TaxID=7959 RepID=UPI00223193DC|nr:complement factor H isoform X12 [Ctenopharyngodon idella]